MRNSCWVHIIHIRLMPLDETVEMFRFVIVSAHFSRWSHTCQKQQKCFWFVIPGRTFFHVHPIHITVIAETFQFVIPGRTLFHLQLIHIKCNSWNVLIWYHWLHIVSCQTRTYQYHSWTFWFVIAGHTLFHVGLKHVSSYLKGFDLLSLGAYCFTLDSYISVKLLKWFDLYIAGRHCFTLDSYISVK